MDDAIESLLNQGYLARREGRLADAKDIYAEAVDLCRAAKDQALLALALKRLGGIKRDLHEIDVHEIEAALQDYQEAAAIDRALEDPLNLAHTIRHIGDILREDGKPDAALPCYEEALQIYRNHPETGTLDLANTLRGFALLKSTLGETDAATALWQEAGSLYNQVWQEPGSPYKEADLAPGIAESQRQIALLKAR